MNTNRREEGEEKFVKRRKSGDQNHRRERKRGMNNPDQKCALREQKRKYLSCNTSRAAQTSQSASINSRRKRSTQEHWHPYAVAAIRALLSLIIRRWRLRIAGRFAALKDCSCRKHRPRAKSVVIVQCAHTTHYYLPFRLATRKGERQSCRCPLTILGG